MKTPQEALEILVREISGYAGAAVERSVYGVIGAAHAFHQIGKLSINEAVLWGDRARLAGVEKGWAPPGLTRESLIRQIKEAEHILPPPPPEASPGPGETCATKLPDSFDGIRFTISRMAQYIQDGRKDPLVIATARKIAALSNTGHRPTGPRERLRHFRAIHAWCVSNFAFVSDPVNIELLQTPNRMLRELQIPTLLQRAIWGPLRKQDWSPRCPAPKMTGDADEATVISLALAAAIGIEPLRIVLGGTEGTAHTCWGAARIVDDWVSLDVLHPKFGGHQKVLEIEHLDVPL